jgi:hypothetical protein
MQHIQPKDDYVEFEALPGTTVEVAVAEVLGYARKYMTNAILVFNGVSLYIQYNSTVKQVVDFYMQKSWG